jgi:hypothetical protein
VLLAGLDPYKAGIYDLNQTKLFLTLVFNRSENAKTYLTALREIARDIVSSKEGAHPGEAIEQKLFQDLEDALLWSLVHQRTSFVMLLCPMLNSAPETPGIPDTNIASLHDFVFGNNNDVLQRIFSTRFNKRAKPYLEVLYESTCGLQNSSPMQAFARTSLDSAEDQSTLRRRSIRHHPKQPNSAVWSPAATQGRHTSLTAQVDICNMVNRLILKTLFGPIVGRHMNEPETDEFGVPSRKAFKVIGYTMCDSEYDKVAQYSNAPPHKLQSNRAYQDLTVWASISGYLHHTARLLPGARACVMWQVLSTLGSVNGLV